MALERQPLIGPPAPPPVLTDEQMNALSSAPPQTMNDTQMTAVDSLPKVLFDEQMDTLIAEKPDQATIDRMRFVEKGVPFRPTDLGTIGTTAVRQLAETPVGIIRGGIEGAKAAIQKPKEIIPAMKEAYDYAASPEGQKEMVKAGYENTKGLITFLPTTFINFVKNPQKQVTEDPVGTLFLLGAVGGGAAKLATRKLRAKTPLAPEELKAIAEEIAPDQSKIAENTEKLRTIAEPEIEFQKAEGPAAHVAEAGWSPEAMSRTRANDYYIYDTNTKSSRPLVGVDAIDVQPGPFEIKYQKNKLTGKVDTIAMGDKAMAPTTMPEAPQTPVFQPAERSRAAPEPKTPPTPYPPTGEIVSPTEIARLRGIEADKIAWDKAHEGVRKYGSLQTFMEIPIEETRASAELGVAEAKQALAERAGEIKPPAPTTEVLPEFTREQSEARDLAEQKAKRDRVQGLPEKLTVSPEWKPEWDDLIVPALDKAKIKPEHRANATLLLKHGFSMAKVTGKDPAKAMEHYLNSIKPRLRADERFPETQMPEVKTEEGALEIEPTAEMAKGEPQPKGKNIIPEPSEVEAIAKRRELMLDEIGKEFDDYEGTLTDAKEKEMFRAWRGGLQGKTAEKELQKGGIKVADDTIRARAKKWESEMRERISAKAEGIVDKVRKEIEFDDNLDELADKGISKDYENWQKQREGGFVVLPAPGKAGGPSVVSKIKPGLNHFYQDAMDRFHAIKSIVQIARDDGVSVPVQKDPYIKARNYLGVQAMAEEKIFYRRFKIDENTGKVVWGDKSLQDIVKPHKKEMDKWDTYLVARHSPEIAARGLETGRDPAVDKAFVAKYAPQFEADAKEFTAYHNSLLKELVDAGRLKKETYDELTTRYPNYAAFNRVLDEVVEHGYVPSSAKLLSKIPNPIKRLKGSERPIISPTESAIKATYVITNVAERQRIAKSIFDLREQSPELKEIIKPIKPRMDLVATLEDGTKVFRPSALQKEGVIEFFEKGERHFYEVPKDIYESMSQLSETGHNWMIKILAAPSRLLRAGATLTPDFFMGTNPFRDQTTAFMNAKYGYVPWFDFAKGLFNLVKKPEGYHAWRASGGEWSMLVALDRATNQATLKKVLGEKDYTRYLKKPWTFLEDVSMYGERPTRLSVFREARKQVSDVEAAFQSREASTDFARRGASMKSVSAIYTFLNARMQGTDKLIRTMKENPAQAMLKGISIASIPSLTLYLINRSDDKFWEIPEWQRRMFWIIPVGGGHYMRIPKGEVGIIFGTTTEMIMEHLDKDKESKKRIDQMAGSIIKELSPIGNLGEIMPTAFRPIMEWFYNKNFFTGRPVVGRRHEGIKPEYQYEPYTTETAKAIGKTIGASPSKIENLGRGYLGGMSNYIFTVGDGILSEMGIVPKPKEMPRSMQRTPVLKTFTVNDPTGFNSDSVNKFYESFGKVDEFKRTFDKLKKQGQVDELKRLVQDDPLNYRAVSTLIPGKGGQTTIYKEFSAATKTLSDYRKKRIGIIESNLTAEKKEELINKLDEYILQTVVPVLAKYRGLESWLKKGKEND